MAELARPSLLGRLLKAFRPPSELVEVKAPGDTSGVLLDPRIQFWSPDGTKNIYAVPSGSSETSVTSRDMAYLTAAYCYVAMRWRATQLAKAPLMVVEEDQDTGDDQWIPNHPLTELLERPSPDYGMRELIYRTSLAVDRDGSALWLKDATNGRGEFTRLTFYSGNEFSVTTTRDRLRGEFTLNRRSGDLTVAADRVIYFHDPNPNSWLQGASKVDVALSWLNLGQATRATVRDLLLNAVWPSIVVSTEKDWSPTPEDLEIFKRDLGSYSMGGKRGEPFVAMGGAQVTVVSARIRDLLPVEIFDQVESVVAAVFGVPAVVLQFGVGLKNSPWSQMAESRSMAIQDTTLPQWTEYADLLTLGMLRQVDQDPTHFIRFDTSRIPELQVDRLAQAQLVATIRKEASLNERRALLGLEPSDDPAADDIPELNPVAVPFGFPGSTETTPPEKGDPGTRERKQSLWVHLRREEAAKQVFGWQVAVGRAFDAEKAAIDQLAETHLGSGKAADDTPTDGQTLRFLASIAEYFAGPGRKRWEVTVAPLVRKGAAAATKTIAADFRISYNLVRPEVEAYAKREVGFLIRSITETTRQAIADAVAKGLQEGIGARALAKRLQDLAAFSPARALLIARTESTRVTQGGPTEALAKTSATAGRRFVKTWSTAADDRVRDEHEAMEGETVGLEESFSNGLDFPQEPNCRCVLTYAEIAE